MATVGKGGKAIFYPAPDPTEHFFPQCQHHQLQNACTDARITTSSSRDEAASTASVGNGSDINDATEWVEQDEPGVFVTIRQLADGTRDLRRVRFRHVLAAVLIN